MIVSPNDLAISKSLNSTTFLFGVVLAFEKLRDGIDEELEDFLSISADYVDIVKLGWGTSVLTQN